MRKIVIGVTKCKFNVLRFRFRERQYPQYVQSSRLGVPNVAGGHLTAGERAGISCQEFSRKWGGFLK